jgi:hypothetical protein
MNLVQMSQYLCIESSRIIIGENKVAFTLTVSVSPRHYLYVGYAQSNFTICRRN